MCETALFFFNFCMSLSSSFSNFIIKWVCMYKFMACTYCCTSSINYFFQTRRTESSIRRMGARKTSYGPPRVASFLLGLPPKPPYPLKKALKNYHVRLNRHHIQYIEVRKYLPTNSYFSTHTIATASFKSL